jgi:hypothetical protein
MFTQLTQPTLALVLWVKFNMVEENVVTLGFSKETPKPYPTSLTQ